MKVKLADIYVGKRRRIEMGDIEDLAEDLRKNGQITAITVRKPAQDDQLQSDYEGQPWVLVAGGRRFAAATRNNWDEIAAFDKEDIGDEIQHRVVELHENVKRKDMTWQEIAAAKHELLALRREQNPEITQAEVAKEIGETPANFSRDIAVAEAVQQRPELKNAASKKSALRHAKTAEHFEARVQRESPNYALDLKRRLTTAKMEDWLRQLPDGYAMLTMPDLPYGIDHFSQGHKSEQGGISEYDDAEGVSQDLFFDVVPQLIRVTDRHGWVICFMAEANYDLLKMLFSTCCTTHFDYLADKDTGRCLSAGNDPRGCNYAPPEEPRWIWYRPNSMNNPRSPERNAKNMYEPILAYRMPEGRLVRPCANVLVHEAEYGNERTHAMQKPIGLYLDLISRVTLAGETVIDPCFGSANSLAAGAVLSRDIWGCDMNPNLLPAALGKVSQHFDGVAPKAERLPEVEPYTPAYRLRLYTQMLKSGMKLNEKQQAEYDELSKESVDA